MTDSKTLALAAAIFVLAINIRSCWREGKFTLAGVLALPIIIYLLTEP